MNKKLLKTLSSGTGYGNIICFPFAGGNSISYRALSRHFQNSKWGVLAIEPPGHGTNPANLLNDINTMVSLYEEAILKEVSKPFVLFGHSLGGLITYLLTQRLEKRGLIPSAVFISAANPPDVEREKKSHLAEEQLIDYINNLGGMPRELLEHKELQDFLVPIFRSDFKAIESYTHTNQTLIKSPTYIFGGKEDRGCPQELLFGWKKWLLQAEFFLFDGGHMFLVDHSEAVAKQMLCILNEKVK